MDSLFLITSIFFFVYVVRNSLFWLHLWQIKEYRLDRMLVHLKETRGGRDLLLHIWHVAKIFLLVSPLFLSLYTKSSVWWRGYGILVSILFFISFFNVIQELKSRRVRFPIFTPKVIFIFVATVTIEVLFYLMPVLDKFFWLLFLDRLVPLVIATSIATFSVPSELYRDFTIMKAARKLETYKNLLVIGITGSYGKGSTKEFVKKVLSTRFNVVATVGTLNTSIGISRTIFEIRKNTHIFVVEMGAYQVGEIWQMCEIVKPKIGILTAVNDQHLSLFGTLQHIKKAKYELIESLPKESGLALFNGNNPIVLSLSKKTKQRKVVYYADYRGEEGDSYDIKASHIRLHKFHISFNVTFKDTNRSIEQIKVRVLGKHNVENLLPALYIGYSLGLGEKELREGLGRIVPLKKTMEPFITPRGVVLIDDTFNANPASIVAACDYMKIYKGKKVCVLQSMIELGAHAEKDHRAVALYIGAVCDILILTNHNFFRVMADAIQEAGSKCMVRVKGPQDTADFIQETLEKGDVVVFEGKEAASSFSLLERKVVYPQ